MKINDFLLIYCFSEDEKVHSSKISIESFNCTLRSDLSDELMRMMIWSLAKISHSFIKIEEPEIKQKDVGSAQSLLKTKLFSGGIENRFLNTFSEESQEHIVNLASISGDNNLVKYLHESEEMEDDSIMQAIIHEGKDANVDKFINILQWSLLRKNPTARVGGKEGMILSRCAFAATLSLNQSDETCSITNIMMIIDHLEMAEQELDTSLNENQKNKQLLEELNSVSDIEPFKQRWESASKMRIWLQEKKRDISNAIKKKADSEYQKKKLEADSLDKLLSRSKSVAEDKKESQEDGESDEDIIKTDVQPTSAQIKVVSDEELISREKEQIQILIDKVIAKAELLLQLATPRAWNEPDSSDSKILNVSHYSNKKKHENESVRDKLRRIKNIQASKATITSYEDVSNKEIFNS